MSAASAASRRVISGDGSAEISVTAPLILLIIAEPCQPSASEETVKSAGSGVHQNNTSASLPSCPVAMETKHPIRLADEGPRYNTPQNSSTYYSAARAARL